MKNDVLYVNGCSFAYGQGVSESESVCINDRFSKTLSDHFGLTEINNALPGSCNSRIARRTLVDMIQYKPKLAVIIWSDPSRTEFKDADMLGRFKKYPFELGQAKVSSLKYSPKAVSVYYNKLRSVEQEVMNTLYHMLAVKMAADSMSIPCIQLHFREGFSKDLIYAIRGGNDRCKQTIYEYLDILNSDELVYGGLGREMCSFEMLGGGYLDETGHPNKVSHDNLTRWIINLVNKKNIL